MDDAEFRKRGKELIDFMVDFKISVKDRPVYPDVEPGYLKSLIPTEMPTDPEPFESILDDFDKKIVKGTLFWGHPRFHAYFPAGNSYPSIMGDMLNGIINVVGFSWPSGPSCTELEIIMMDWFAKALGLPDKFLSTGKGAGVLQGSASDGIMMVFIAARYNALEVLKKEFGYDDERKVELLPKLVAYCSKESHSCVEKAALLCMVKLRALEVTDDGNVAPETLDQAMAEDEAKGLKPFIYTAILGSTSQASFDNLAELAPVCRKRPSYFWLHADGAYAGNSFILPEMRYLMKGIEHTNSFNVNMNKWLLTLFDSSCLWIDDEIKFTQAQVVDPIYLQHSDTGIIDRRHFHIALSRRFRSLKLWLVFRIFGIKKLQEYIRNHIRLAKYFESLVLKDDRFIITNIVRTGLVCFRLKAGNAATEELLTQINVSREIHLTPTKIKNDKFVVRFCVNHEEASKEDIDIAWDIIRKYTTIVLASKPNREESDEFTRSVQERRLSFTVAVSQEVYRNNSGNLYDPGTPILVPEKKDT